MMEKYFGKDEQSSHAQPKMEQARSKVVVDKKIVVEEAVLPIKDHVVRTYLLQERENDGIPRAKKQRRFNELVPNSRVQDIKEEFHGLSEDEWKKYKDESKQNENRRKGEQRVRAHSDYSASVERNPF